MLGDDVLYLSVRELGERIRARKLSPVELTDAYLARSQKLGKQLNAYVTLTAESARAQAQAAEREIKSGKYRGPLHGIPYAVKDLIAVAGHPTTWGARPFKDQRFPADATIIKRLGDAGAILLGKAAMIELAGGFGYGSGAASLTGAAINPWDASCWTCGSSSGSGAIVSAALAAFAIGSETWGSILCPAAHCGVTGLRPTYGRVSRHGAMALSYSLDKLGPLARSVEDCALVLAAIAGHDPADPASLPDAAYAPSTKLPAARSLRVGWVTDQAQGMSSGVAAAFGVARAALEKSGVTIADTMLPSGPWGAAAWMVIECEGASAFQSLIESGRIGEVSDPSLMTGAYVAAEIPASDLMRAFRIRQALVSKLDAVWDKFDVLVGPSRGETAYKLTTNLETAPDYPDPMGACGNFAGLPAIGVPCGLVGGLPIGLQFLAAPLEEAKIISIAGHFEKITDWHTRRPPLA